MTRHLSGLQIELWIWVGLALETGDASLKTERKEDLVERYDVSTELIALNGSQHL